MNIVQRPRERRLARMETRGEMIGLRRHLNIRSRMDGEQRQPSPHALLPIFLFAFRFRFSFAFGYGLGLCSANLGQERLSCRWSRHFA